jgi:cell division inhibitor SepF
MGALRKAGVWLGLVEDEDDQYEPDRHYDGGTRHEGASRYDRRRYERAYDDDDREFADDDYDDDVVETPPRSRLSERSERVERIDRGERASVRPLNRAGAMSLTQDNLALAPQVQLRERAVVSDDRDGYRITTVHPTTYNEARTIGEHFRDGTPVIMNLSEMDEADAMRLVDFAAGLIFGLRGTIERVTNRVFLLSPANVTVTAEDKAKIAEGGFFNQS